MIRIVLLPSKTSVACRRVAAHLAAQLFNSCRSESDLEEELIVEICECGVQSLSNEKDLQCASEFMSYHSLVSSRQSIREYRQYTK